MKALYFFIGTVWALWFVLIGLFFLPFAAAGVACECCAWVLYRFTLSGIHLLTGIDP